MPLKWFAFNHFPSKPIQIHCIHPLYRCPENGIAHSQSWCICSLSTPNNRFCLQWAVAVELHVSFSERKIHSVHALVCVCPLLSNRTRCAPIWKQRILCRFRFCSSFWRFVPRNLKFNSFAAQLYGELTETELFNAPFSLCLVFPICLSACMYREVNAARNELRDSMLKKRTKLLRRSLYCLEFFFRFFAGTIFF